MSASLCRPSKASLPVAQCSGCPGSFRALPAWSTHGSPQTGSAVLHRSQNRPAAFASFLSARRPVLTRRCCHADSNKTNIDRPGACEPRRLVALSSTLMSANLAADRGMPAGHSPGLSQLSPTSLSQLHLVHSWTKWLMCSLRYFLFGYAAALELAKVSCSTIVCQVKFSRRYPLMQLRHVDAILCRSVWEQPLVSAGQSL